MADQKKGGSSDAVMNDRRRSGRLDIFLVMRQSVVRSSSRVSESSRKVERPIIGWWPKDRALPCSLSMIGPLRAVTMVEAG